MRRCRIFQFDPYLPREERRWAFFGWDTALEDGFDQSAYICVYDCDLDDDVSLEDIFYIFNEQRPDDFEGHSLSVSDVVELDGNAHYVDTFGFARISPDYWRTGEWEE